MASYPGARNALIQSKRIKNSISIIYATKFDRLFHQPIGGISGARHQCAELAQSMVNQTGSIARHPISQFESGLLRVQYVLLVGSFGAGYAGMMVGEIIGRPPFLPAGLSLRIHAVPRWSEKRNHDRELSSGFEVNNHIISCLNVEATDRIFVVHPIKRDARLTGGRNSTWDPADLGLMHQSVAFQSWHGSELMRPNASSKSYTIRAQGI